VRLRYVDQNEHGLTRRRRGGGFEYLDADGHKVDAATVERIRGLAIPPAWKEVWICPWPTGHLQATGRDAAGRLQYLYHPGWRAERDREKFARMVDFAAELPSLRSQVAADLAARGLGRERLLACATRLLDRGFFRVGGETYAEENGTFGLATLQRNHVRLTGGGSMLFSYRAKGGLPRRFHLVDDEVMAVIRSLKSRSGPAELLAYRNGNGWADVRSGDINAYIRSWSHGPYSAKDFRTWHATVLAASAVALLGARARSDAGRRRVVLHASREVARYLGNTPAVCRDSYIHPAVFERFYAGEMIEVDLDEVARRDGIPVDDLSSSEKAVLTLLAPARARRRFRPRRRGNPDSASNRNHHAETEGRQMPSNKANVKNEKNEKQYEALKDKGMSKERAARIANSTGASSKGGKSSSRSSSSQGGTTAQKKTAGRKGGRASAPKR
jgi:DNA topoisomerase-1